MTICPICLRPHGWGSLLADETLVRCALRSWVTLRSSASASLWQWKAAGGGYWDGAPPLHEVSREARRPATTMRAELLDDVLDFEILLKRLAREGLYRDLVNWFNRRPSNGTGMARLAELLHAAAPMESEDADDF